MKKFNILDLFNNMLEKIAKDSHVAFFVGIMFILAGTLSLFDKVIEDLIGREIEFFHGAIFLGVFNLCMSIVFMINGAKNIEAGESARLNAHSKSPPILSEESERIGLLENEIKELRVNIKSLKKEGSM